MTGGAVPTTPDDGRSLPSWVRNLVILIAMGGWAATIAGYLLQGKLPDAAILGVPGAVYLAMSPNLPSIGRRPKSGGDK